MPGYYLNIHHVPNASFGNFLRPRTQQACYKREAETGAVSTIYRFVRQASERKFFTTRHENGSIQNRGQLHVYTTGGLDRSYDFQLRVTRLAQHRKRTNVEQAKIVPCAARNYDGRRGRLETSVFGEHPSERWHVRSTCEHHK